VTWGTVARSEVSQFGVSQFGDSNPQPHRSVGLGKLSRAVHRWLWSRTTFQACRRVTMVVCQLGSIGSSRVACSPSPIFRLKVGAATALISPGWSAALGMYRSLTVGHPAAYRVGHASGRGGWWLALPSGQGPDLHLTW